jgi:hypothetical protein
MLGHWTASTHDVYRFFAGGPFWATAAWRTPSAAQTSRCFMGSLERGCLGVARQPRGIMCLAGGCMRLLDGSLLGWLALTAA